MSFQEVAELLTLRGYPTTPKVAWHLENQALKKLAADPSLRAMAVEIGICESGHKRLA